MYNLSRFGNPNYNIKQDFTTNAESYLEYLGAINEQLDSVMKLVARLINRDVEVEDTNTVDLTKIGDFIAELDPNFDLEEVIKIKADVLISAATGDAQLNSLLPKPLLMELQNAVEAKEDGLFVKDLYAMIYKLDEHVGTLIDRVDEINVDGSTVMIGGFNQYNTDLVTQSNQQQVKNQLVKNDPNITNLTLVTDIHLRTDINGFSSRQYYDSIHNIQDVARETHSVFYMGDNMDGINGQVTDNAAVIPPERVKYSNLTAARKVANALVMNEPVDTFMLIGNHDIGGLPYLRDGKARHEKEILTATELSKIYGNAPYGTHKIPNQQVAIVWLNTMDLTYQEMLSFDSGVGEAQLNFLEGQLTTLEANYNILVMGHHDLDVTKMKNGQRLVDIMAAFEARETSKFIGYAHGHLHLDRVSPKGTLQAFNIISLRQAYPADSNKVGTNTQAGFHVLEIDISKRTATLKPIGNAALTDIIAY
jgi:hypothetical protein